MDAPDMQTQRKTEFDTYAVQALVLCGRFVPQTCTGAQTPLLSPPSSDSPFSENSGICPHAPHRRQIQRSPPCCSFPDFWGLQPPPTRKKN